MDKKLVIRIKHRSQSEVMIQLLVLLPFLLSALTELLPFPDGIKYVCDAAWLYLLVLLIIQRKPAGKGYAALFSLIIFFFIYTVLNYVVNFQSPLYYLWGVRNNFRFYAAFLAFTYFLKEEQAEYYFSLFDKIFWIDAAVSLIQYYVFGIDGDYLGGVFGAKNGCNGYTTVFFAIIVVKSVVFFLEGKETAWLCMAKCAVALYIAALAELKFFFAAFLLIVLLGAMWTGFTWRKLLLILGGALGVSLGTALLTQMFSGGVKWFTLEWLLETASADRGYTSSGDLNRLNAIPQINELWLTNWGQRLFGLGLGNCDTSNFAIVNTPFYKANGDMHYTWICYAMMYLETGYIGLVFYWGFFALVFAGAHRIEKRSEGITKTYCRIAKIMAVMCVIITVYNSSLRAEAGYMAYFVLAIPFALGKRRSQQV